MLCFAHSTDGCCFTPAFADRFHRPDKGFQGADGVGLHRDGPVQFEKEPAKDMFGLDQFLTDAKDRSKKRSGDEGDRDGKRRR